MTLHSEYLEHIWAVFVIFLIPFGGGIPAGVVLAQKFQLPWALTSVLYFISDFALVAVFEPAMLIFLEKSKTVPALAKVREAMAQSTGKLIERYGLHPSPFALVAISIGADPMTARAVSKIAGYTFFTGWLWALVGDMIFFGIIAASTLWLNQYLSETWTIVIITVLLLGIPPLIQKVKQRLFFVE